jgi:ankyrin repeat protein
MQWRSSEAFIDVAKVLLGDDADVGSVQTYRKADVDARCEGGMAPLHLALKRPSLDMVRLLLKHQAKVDETALSFAQDDETKALLMSTRF